MGVEPRIPGDEGYFPAGRSVLRAVHAERVVGLNYGQRALMLGAAHPVNFIGTQANTRSGARPFLRLAHTAKAFETIFFGTRAEADKVLGFVERMHSRVAGELAEPAGPWPAGTPYTAFDPELMLWTVAVIADSAEAFYETLVRRLSADEKDALWRDYMRFGELFGMPRDGGTRDVRGLPRLLGGDVDRRRAAPDRRGPGGGARGRLRDPDAAPPAPVARGAQPGPRRDAARAGQAAVRPALDAPARGRLPLGGAPESAPPARSLPSGCAAGPTPPRSRWSPGPSARWSPAGARRCPPGWPRSPARTRARGRASAPSASAAPRAGRGRCRGRGRRRCS